MSRHEERLDCPLEGILILVHTSVNIVLDLIDSSNEIDTRLLIRRRRTLQNRQGALKLQRVICIFEKAGSNCCVERNTCKTFQC